MQFAGYQTIENIHATKECSLLVNVAFWHGKSVY